MIILSTPIILVLLLYRLVHIVLIIFTWWRENLNWIWALLKHTRSILMLQGSLFRRWLWRRKKCRWIASFILWMNSTWDSSTTNRSKSSEKRWGKRWKIPPVPFRISSLMSTSRLSNHRKQKSMTLSRETEKKSWWFWEK